MPPDSRLHNVVRPIGQLDEIEQLIGTLPNDLATQPEVAPVYQQVLSNRQLVVEGVFLRYDTQLRPDSGPCVVGSMPNTLRSPPVAGETQPIIRIVELLPAPFGPRKPNASPCITSTSMPSTATKVAEPLGEVRADTRASDAGRVTPSRY